MEVRAAGSGIAVFDLDGTLCAQDTLRAYLRMHLVRFPAQALRGWALPADVLLHAAGRRDEGWLKARMVAALLSGLPPEAAAAVAGEIAALVAGPWLRNGARRALDEHSERGDRLVLASASLDIWVLAVAARLGFHDVAGSSMARRDDGSVAGVLAGANCKGTAKLERVKALVGERPAARVVAYSDHHDDLPLLTWADHGVAVNPTPRLRQRANDLGLSVVDWD